MLFVLCVLMLSGLTVVCRADSKANASQAIADAEQRVFSCYGAVTDAAKAGANVTVLLSNLTVAGNLLSKADLAFENGDFNSSQPLALQSQQVLEGFEAEADVLRQTAAQDRSQDFAVNVVGSSAAAVVVVLCAFVVWAALKTRYRQGQ